ncbi:MAG: leucine-rich repeat domain-containing protein [bacterium]
MRARHPGWRVLAMGALGLLFSAATIYGWGLVPGTAAADEAEISPTLRSDILFTSYQQRRWSNDTVQIRLLAGFRHLDLHGGVESLRGIEQCSLLEEITSRSGRGSWMPAGRYGSRHNPLTSLNSLATLSHLRVIRLPGFGIRDIAALRGLPNLTELELGVNQIEDFTPLESCTHLTQLALGYREFLLQKGHINHGGIAHSYPFPTRGNLDSIRHTVLPVSLEALAIPGLLVGDLMFLVNLQNLRTLDIGGTAITSIAPLRQLPLLETVWLDNNTITDSEVLLELPHLKRVLLDGDQFPEGDPLITALEAKGVKVTRSMMHLRNGFPQEHS